MAGTPFRATYIWTSIISNLQSQVEVKQRRYNLKTYQNCFLGSEAVDVVLAHITLNRFFGEEVVPRYKATRLCQALMVSKVFEPVGVKVFGKQKKKPRFEDSSYSLYRFLNPEASSSPSSAVTNAPSQSSDTEEDGSSLPSVNHNKSNYTLSPERQEVPIYFTHSVVRTPKFLENVLEELNLSSAITPETVSLGLSQEHLYEVWHQQAVSRLLQLMELPLLEDSLGGEVTSKGHQQGTDSHPVLLHTSIYMDREVLKAFSEAHDDEWMSAALDCLEFLPDDLVVEVSRGMADRSDDLLLSKKLLYQVLAKHYGQTQRPPLLNNCYFDIYSGISELLVNGKLEQALEALQLSLKLQDSFSREELRRLLRFMATAANSKEVKVHEEIENRIAVKRGFSSAIVFSSRLPKGKVGLMVLFMMDNYNELFKIPFSLHKTVIERIQNILNGRDPGVITAGTTYGSRVSLKTYSESTQETTKKEILSLLQTIHESSRFSVKEKRQLLGQLSRVHPDIFVQYFGNKLSHVNMLLQ